MSAPTNAPVTAAAGIVVMLEQLAIECQRLARTVANQLAEVGAGEPHGHGDDNATGTATPMTMTTAINTIDTVPAMAKPKAHKPSVLMTPEEFAEILQVDLRTLRRWRHEGHVPQPIEIGGALRWRRVDIERWLEQKAT